MEHRGIEGAGGAGGKRPFISSAIFDEQGIFLGSNLECYVDNCLRFDVAGNVVGRNGGIRGWIAENVPELLPKYKTLMRYKALAVRIRQATE